jgi:hypothetical protein
MLHSMQEEITNPSPQSGHDFAGLLAALAVAKPTELPAWNDEELPRDVATLSYERALRKHARYSSGQDGMMAPIRGSQSEDRNPTGQTGTRNAMHNREPLEQAAGAVPMTVRDRKCASVTIRMSRAEFEQLRERAAEAGLTISAYLRSCTFEAEALRAQVKQALAELRSAHAPDAKPAMDQDMQKAKAAISESSQNLSDARSGPRPRSGTRLNWLRRIIPDRHAARNFARA